MGRRRRKWRESSGEGREGGGEEQTARVRNEGEGGMRAKVGEGREKRREEQV